MLEASLLVKANLYFGDQDEEKVPLSGMTIYLLDKSLVDILRESGFEPEAEDGEKLLATESDYLAAAGEAFRSNDEESLIVRLAMESEISKHQIIRAQTDRRGLARISRLKTGAFYLLAITNREEAEILLWNLPVDIKSGGNMIELDQHNSASLD